MINFRQSSLCLPLATAMALCAMVALSAGARGDASSQPSWKVHEKLLGKPKNAAGTDFKKSEDASGIACASPSGFPRACLVVDDESQGAQIVIVKDGELIAGDFIRLITDSYAGKLLELDAEGAAFADGAFYVIGSHGRARHEADATEEAKNNAKADATRRVFRIRFNAEAVDLNTGKLTGTPEIKPADLSRFIQAQPELAASFDKPLKQNGLTIEGVAVLDGRLYAGMRGPVLNDVSAVMLSVPLTSLFDGQDGQSKLHPMILGKDTQGKPRGIRDIAVHGGALLLIAGPVNDPEGDEVKPGDYAIYTFNGTGADKRFDLDTYGNKVKPEGLLPLDEKDGKLRALLLFDGPEEGAPRPVEFKLR